MLKALAFGMGCGAAIQAWRAFPPSLPMTGDAVAVVFIVGLVAAYLGGRSRRGGSATATATATATASAESSSSASQSVNLFVVAGQTAADSSVVRMPSEAAPWMVGATERPALTGDLLDGYDLTELLEQEPDLERTD